MKWTYKATISSHWDSLDSAKRSWQKFNHFSPVLLGIRPDPTQSPTLAWKESNTQQAGFSLQGAVCVSMYFVSCCILEQKEWPLSRTSFHCLSFAVVAPQEWQNKGCSMAVLNAFALVDSLVPKWASLTPVLVFSVKKSLLYSPGKHCFHPQSQYIPPYQLVSQFIFIQPWGIIATLNSRCLKLLSPDIDILEWLMTLLSLCALKPICLDTVKWVSHAGRAHNQWKGQKSFYCLFAK